MDPKVENRPLPKGWVVRASKSRNGRSYYFNVVSGTSSWKHPVDLLDEIDKAPKYKKKNRHRNRSSTDSSVVSEEIPSKRSKLLSPPSPSSQHTPVTTIIEKTAKETVEKKPEEKSPKYEKTSTIEPEPYPESDHEGSAKLLKLSSKNPQFACSRSKASHIAQWVNHVNNSYEPSEQGSVVSEVTSMFKGDLDDAVSFKSCVNEEGFKEKEKKVLENLIPEEKEDPKVLEEEYKEKAEKAKEKNSSDSLNKDSKHVNTVTQQSESFNKEKSNARPPLKKVEKRKRKTLNGKDSTCNSSGKPCLSSSPTKINTFTPFGQHQQQQSELRYEQTNHTSTPMNIEKAGATLQKFSTPFLKSPTGARLNPQVFFSTPTNTGTSNNSFSPLNENSFQSQPNFGNESSVQLQGRSDLRPETTQQVNSEQLFENVLQPDSGFDEVIEMEVDNFEELTETIKAELQEVRSDFQLDAQKIQQERTFSDSSSYGDGIYITLDTNVLLSHLKFISELKDFPIQGVGRPTLVVPWIVMQELDSLKSDSWRTRQGKVNQESKDGGAVGVDSLARQAIRFLNTCFESKHPRIRGQTIEEASEHMIAMLEESNDDRILHCCLLFKRKVSNGNSILFSNDQNLCSKAMVNGICAFNHKTLIEGLKELDGGNQNKTVALHGDYFKEYYEQLSVEQKLAEKREKADDILCELQCIMREGLSVCVEAEMRLAYEDLWDTIVYIKPPWTLLDLLVILNKHWIAVFGDVVDRKLQHVVKELLKLLDPQKGVPGCMDKVAPIVDLAKNLFDGFASHSSYNGGITQCVAAIAVLQQKCSQGENESLPHPNIPPPALPSRTPPLPHSEPSVPARIDEVTPTNSDETTSVASVSVHGEINTSASSQPHRHVLSTFEVIWSAVTQFSAQIFHALSYPNSIPPSVIENLPKPTRDEAIAFLGRLCRCLGTLVTALQSVLRVPVESLGEEPHSLDKLISAIGSFLQEILNQESRVSVEGLFYFCQDSNSRTALVQGLSQLDRALAMLQHCASCIV